MSRAVGGVLAITAAGGDGYAALSPPIVVPSVVVQDGRH